MVRRAFTLIELIFAIVVMSIVFLSFPIIMQTDSDAREQNFVQEAALAASAKMAQLYTYQWDEASLSWADLTENIQTVARLTDGTDHNTTAFNRVAGTELRSNGGHRRFFSPQTNATAIGDQNNTVIALDDQEINFAVGSGFDAGFLADSFGYKREYEMDVKIVPVNDALRIGGGAVNYALSDLTGNDGFVFTQGNAGGQTNLRSIVVSIGVRDSGGNVDVLTRLYGYAANIGEYAAYSKVRP